MTASPHAPDEHVIAHALEVAALSPCRSKRGVALYDPRTGAHRGSGFNGPPGLLTCPGRAICSGTCGQRSVHAEVRALRSAATYFDNHPSGPYDLVHVELAADGGVKPCSGPSCWQCSREILDVGFVGGVWIYEAMPDEWCPHVDMRRTECGFCHGVDCIADSGVCSAAGRGERCGHDVLARHGEMPVVRARWRRYSAAEFHRVTLERCGMAT